MNYVLSLLSVLCLATAQPAQAQSVPKQVKGIAVYTYQKTGGHSPSKTTLRFSEQGAWYSRHEKKGEEKTKEGYTVYSYFDERDWYTTADSLYVYRRFEDYPVPFYSRSPKPVIDWQLTDETQVIAGYTARKAIGKSLYETHPASDSKIGDAIAWFTTEIPLPYGPDGYQGLPGLIVKLEYTGERNGLKTILQRIEYADVASWSLPATTDKVEVTLDQAYSVWKIDDKWFKKRAKGLKL